MESCYDRALNINEKCMSHLLKAKSLLTYITDNIFQGTKIRLK